jgi:DNA-binding CsgD family transcriptional regulator
MRRLMPHLQQAHDVATRLRAARVANRTFEQALDWLSDGVALLRRDGRICYANEAFQAIARRGDSLRVARGTIEFAAAEDRARFATALGAIGRTADGNARAGGTDFFASRGADAPAYVVSLRPLAGPHRKEHEAVAIAFIRDPLGRAAGALHLLRELFGLTEAEANLALALQAGLSPVTYAQMHSLSTNTIYTHLRHIKDKTGCRRLPELIRRLGDLHVPLRFD